MCLSPLTLPSREKPWVIQSYEHRPLKSLANKDSQGSQLPQSKLPCFSLAPLLWKCSHRHQWWHVTLCWSVPKINVPIASCPHQLTPQEHGPKYQSPPVSMGRHGWFQLACTTQLNCESVAPCSYWLNSVILPGFVCPFPVLLSTPSGVHHTIKVLHILKYTVFLIQEILGSLQINSSFISADSTLRIWSTKKPENIF